MITVLFLNQGKYPVSAVHIKKELAEFLAGHGISSDSDISVSLVNEKTMLDVSKKYMKDDLVHDVLSFPAMETRGEFIDPPDGILHLGEIIVCYQMALEEATEDGISVERKVLELILHGALHILGIHHE